MSTRIRRLEMSELQEDLRELLRPRVERLQYLGEFFKCAGHQPQALCAFIEFTESAKKALPKSIVETIALTVAVDQDNSYERNQHERLSVRLGLGKEWIAAIERLDPDDAPLMGEDERIVQRYALSAVRTMGRGSAGHLEAVIDVLGPELAIAVMMVVGRYVVHTIIVKTLKLDAPVPSIWDDGFAA